MAAKKSGKEKTKMDQCRAIFNRTAPANRVRAKMLPKFDAVFGRNATPGKTARYWQIVSTEQ